MPAAVGVNGPEAAVPVALTATAADVNTGVAAHVVSVGSNALKVTFPVGLTPDTVAASEMAPPTATGADALVTIPAAALETITLSLASLQAPVIGALLASPL